MTESLELRVRELFAESFSLLTDRRPRCFFAPGRINLIGEHIDYCGGEVLPAAIQFGTVLIAAPNGTDNCQLVSLNETGKVIFTANGPLTPSRSGHWGDYVRGIFAEYQQAGATLPGLDIAVGGNIPGGGLSSSASLEVGTALVIEAFSDARAESDDFRNRQAISWLAQRAENNFVGVSCGIMDQGAIALGRPGQAMLMNCSDLSVDYFPVELGAFSLLIANTCKTRRLEDSAYNERCEEVAAALDLLREPFGIENLCQLDVSQLDAALAGLTDPVRMRVRHVVSEQDRVTRATKMLKQNHLAGFGKLLNESHRSLAEDYEVTGRELDTLIGLAQRQPGVLGARMMGAGFGGCGLVLLATDAVDTFVDQVGSAYLGKIGYAAEFYPAEIGPGADEILSAVPR